MKLKLMLEQCFTTRCPFKKKEQEDISRKRNSKGVPGISLCLCRTNESKMSATGQSGQSWEKQRLSPGKEM